MKYHPILMSTEMVIATQDGRKTQTRRTRGLEVVNRSLDFANQPNSPDEYELIGIDGGVAYFARHAGQREGVNIGVVYEAKFPYGQVGDRLWVKETWTTDWHTVGNDYEPDVVYKASPPPDYVTVERWRPSIYMPRWASRITLETTGIRAERVQDISIRHDDCMKEGWPFGYQVETLNESPIVTFARYWDSINAKRGYSWESNPWVWVIEFKIVEEETKW